MLPLFLDLNNLPEFILKYNSHMLKFLDWELIAFKLNVSDYPFGTPTDRCISDNYVPLFLSYKPLCCSDHTPGVEEQLIKENKLFIVLMYGCDNTSYMKRFITREEALTWINSSDPIDIYSEENEDILFYNS
jgi:hypothetical protein